MRQPLVMRGLARGETAFMLQNRPMAVAVFFSMGRVSAWMAGTRPAKTAAVALSEHFRLEHDS